MRVPIDISKSKKKNKLIFHRTGFNRISEILIEIITLSAILLMAFFFFLDAYENNQSLILPITILIITLTVVSGIIYSIINTNKLKVIKGISKAKNKIYVEKVSELKNWKIIDKGADYKTLEVDDKWNGFHWGKYLTVIFSESDILLNCYSTDFITSKSPYHWYGNRKVEKEFLGQIEIVKNVP